MLLYLYFLNKDVSRLTLFLFTLTIASVLLIHPTNIFALDSQEKTKISNFIGIFYEGDSQSVLDRINSTVGWENVDKVSISVGENGSLDQFLVSNMTSEQWIPIVVNGTLVNGTVIVVPPVDNGTDTGNNETDTGNNETNPEPKVEICGDGIDNNDNGLVDEDCSIIPPPNPDDIPDQPTKTVNTTSTLRVCSTADVDTGNGFTKMLNIMNDYDCVVLIINGDYCYTNCDQLIAQLSDAGFTKGNTKIPLGNHDSATKTKSFNGLDNNYGTAVFSDADTIESINAYLGVFIIDGNKFDSTQLNAMKGQISNDEAWYKFAVVHQPFVVNKGGQHGENGQFSNYDPIFRANHIDAVLQGHEHNYQRYDINGLEYFVIGTGTHDGPDGVDGDLYGLGDEKWHGFECLKCLDTDNGFVLMDLKIDDPRQHNVNGWFVSSNDGSIKDKFNLRD